MLKFAHFAIISAVTGGSSGAERAFRKEAHRADFDHVERKPGYLYVRSRAISSRTNDNFDTFPAEEIKAAYKTFEGKPVFVNHHNADASRARGVICAAALHEDVNPDGTPDTWVEVMMEVDAIRFPLLAQAIIDGDIERTSMGTDVRYSKCSACGNEAATPLDYCDHIRAHKGTKIRRVNAATGSSEEVLISEICYGLSFFENSLLVEDPADPTAYFLGVELGDEVVASAAKKAKTATLAPREAKGLLDTPVSVFNMAYSSKASKSPEVKSAKCWEGWDSIPTTSMDASVTLTAVEEYLSSSSIDDAVCGDEPIRPGYDVHVLLTDDGDHVVIDGHHRVAIYRTLGKPVPVKILDGSSLARMSHRIQTTARSHRVDKADVVTLIDTLAGLLSDTDYGNVDDLCQVSVEGTNLFCSNSKNVPRSSMPQLSNGTKDLSNDWKQHLRDSGHTVSDQTISADQLKATQNQLNGKKVAGMVQAIKAGTMSDERIFVSADHYIVDGHHRWAAKVAYDLLDARLGDVTMPVSVVSMSIMDLLDDANAFAAEHGIAPRGFNAALHYPMVTTAMVGTPGYLDRASFEQLQARVRTKVQNVPQPTPDDIERNRRSRETSGRAGGDFRGNSTDRRRRRINLATEFGDGQTCGCAHCGVILTVDNLEADKIITGTLGGRYILPNLIPSCRACNHERADNVMEFDGSKTAELLDSSSGSWGILWETRSGKLHRSTDCVRVSPAATIKPVPAQEVTPAAVIALYGERACSTCFPGAPTRKRPLAPRAAMTKQSLLVWADGSPVTTEDLAAIAVDDGILTSDKVTDILASNKHAWTDLESAMRGHLYSNYWGTGKMRVSSGDAAFDPDIGGRPDWLPEPVAASKQASLADRYRVTRAVAGRD